MWKTNNEACCSLKGFFNLKVFNSKEREELALNYRNAQMQGCRPWIILN